MIVTKFSVNSLQLSSRELDVHATSASANALFFSKFNAARCVAIAVSQISRVYCQLSSVEPPPPPDATDRRCVDRVQHEPRVAAAAADAAMT